MELFLKYQGSLKSNADIKEKHRLRRHFHPQIKNFIESQKHLKEKKCWQVATFLKNDPNELCAVNQKGDFYFASLISSKTFLLAEVDLTILWHDLPGQIIGQGDIDNKLKTLFDALSAPPHDSQITGLKPENGEEPFFCLLEDDKLIQNVNIRTHTLLENVDQRDIFVLIHIRSRPTQLVWGNMGL